MRNPELSERRRKIFTEFLKEAPGRNRKPVVEKDPETELKKYVKVKGKAKRQIPVGVEQSQSLTIKDVLRKKEADTI